MYWIIVGVYILSPRSAYRFMQYVEEHAYHTYDAFLKEHGKTSSIVREAETEPVKLT